MNADSEKEISWLHDIEYTEFLKKNRENNISLLNDFLYFLLLEIFSKSETGVDSKDFDSVEDMCEAIWKMDSESKQIANLHDTLGRFISTYVDLDIGCNYKPRYDHSKPNSKPQDNQ